MDVPKFGLEVSYNACGLLSHILSDGEDVWTVDSPKRKDVRRAMTAAIDLFDLNAHRTINYRYVWVIHVLSTFQSLYLWFVSRSFHPLLYLLRDDVTAPEEAKHWVTWALCNLTTVYREYIEKHYPLSSIKY